MTDNTDTNLRILWMEICEALARGRRYYNQAGERLETPDVIIIEMLRNGGVMTEDPREESR